MHDKAMYEITQKVVNSKKETAEVINKRVNEMVVECNNIFNLLDLRNQDILSLIEYIGDLKETIDHVS
jgi:hypothetical protein